MVGDVKEQAQEGEEELEQDEDGTFDERASFPELERSQTGRKTSIFKYYSFKEKGESDFGLARCMQWWPTASRWHRW